MESGLIQQQLDHQKRKEILNGRLPVTQLVSEAMNSDEALSLDSLIQENKPLEKGYRRSTPSMKMDQNNNSQCAESTVLANHIFGAKVGTGHELVLTKSSGEMTIAVESEIDIHSSTKEDRSSTTSAGLLNEVHAYGITEVNEMASCAEPTDVASDLLGAEEETEHQVIPQPIRENIIVAEAIEISANGKTEANEMSLNLNGKNTEEDSCANTNLLHLISAGTLESLDVKEIEKVVEELNLDEDALPLESNDHCEEEYQRSIPPVEMDNNNACAEPTDLASNLLETDEGTGYEVVDTKFSQQLTSVDEREIAINLSTVEEELLEGKSDLGNVTVISNGTPSSLHQMSKPSCASKGNWLISKESPCRVTSTSTEDEFKCSLTSEERLDSVTEFGESNGVGSNETAQDPKEQSDSEFGSPEEGCFSLSDYREISGIYLTNSEIDIEDLCEAEETVFSAKYLDENSLSPIEKRPDILQMSTRRDCEENDLINSPFGSVLDKTIVAIDPEDICDEGTDFVKAYHEPAESTETSCGSSIPVQFLNEACVSNEKRVENGLHTEIFDSIRMAESSGETSMPCTSEALPNDQDKTPLLKLDELSTKTTKPASKGHLSRVLFKAKTEVEKPKSTVPLKTSGMTTIAGGVKPKSRVTNAKSESLKPKEFLRSKKEMPIFTKTDFKIPSSASVRGKTQSTAALPTGKISSGAKSLPLAASTTSKPAPSLSRTTLKNHNLTSTKGSTIRTAPDSTVGAAAITKPATETTAKPRSKSRSNSSTSDGSRDERIKAPVAKIDTQTSALKKSKPLSAASGVTSTTKANVTDKSSKPNTQPRTTSANSKIIKVAGSTKGVSESRARKTTS